MPAALTSASPSPAPDIAGPNASLAVANRHAPTAAEAQRLQLARLLKDPAKLAPIPAPPKEKTLRPAREMMKNVQGSSAGAGSGEFHVYKAARRREYERLKMMEDTTAKETAAQEFEEKKRQWEDEAESKTAKNRAKRQKKKERAKGKAETGSSAAGAAGESKKAGTANANTGPLKKRRLVNGAEVVFRKPGEEGSEDDEGEDDEPGPVLLGGDEAAQTLAGAEAVTGEGVPVAVDTTRITIIEED